MNRKLPLGDEHQRKEEATYAAIAVYERVDGFELRVNDRSTRQDTDPGMTPSRIWFIANQPIKFVHQSWNFRRRRRNESGMFHLHSTDEVLGRSVGFQERNGNRQT